MSVGATMDDLKTRETRWREEAAFFDRIAERVDESSLPIDPMALKRYTRPVLRKRFNKEYRFRILGPLEGKTLLDVGCGEGQNSVMLARMGARVTGIDISQGAIDVARRRAEVNGVPDRVRFVCAPIEQANLPSRSFDIVWGEGILHHVLDDLDLVLKHLARCARPDGLLVFSEPINLSPALRRLRNMIPYHNESTPGERPMLKSELDLVRRYIPDLTVRPYALLGRLDQFILVRFNYERSPVLRRGIVSAMAAFDWMLLSLGLRNLASTCVMYGHPRQNI